MKMSKMLHIRVDDYTYEKILTMKKHYSFKTLNDLIVELIQYGYLTKEAISCGVIIKDKEV